MKKAKPTHKPFRLARGVADPAPREWSAREMYMLFALGFRDGAAIRAMKPDAKGHPSYDRGYAEGQAATSRAISAYCLEIQYQPSLFRLAHSPTCSYSGCSNKPIGGKHKLKMCRKHQPYPA